MDSIVFQMKNNAFDLGSKAISSQWSRDCPTKPLRRKVNLQKSTVYKTIIQWLFKSLGST